MRDYQLEYNKLKAERDMAIRDKKVSDDCALDAFKMGENFSQSHPIEHREFIEAEYRKELIENEMAELTREASSFGVNIH